MGVKPSGANNWKVVPGGKVFVPIVILKLSVLVPVFVNTLVNETVDPAAAVAVGVAGPVKVTPAVDVTVKPTAPDEPVAVAAPLLYDRLAMLFLKPGVVPAGTVTLKVKTPDWPWVT